MNPAESLIARHEGLRLKPYKDTVGKLTIGYGRNLDDIGISESEARILLGNDIEWATKAARRIFEKFDELNGIRRAVLIDMAFNLGEARLGRFFGLIDAVKAQDFERAAIEMLDSLWAKQVKGRALENARIMREGKE